MGWVGQRTRATGELVSVETWNYLHVDSQTFSRYQIQSGAYVTKSAPQLCATNDLVTFDTEVLDTDDYYVATAPTKITAQVYGPVILSYYVPTDIAATFTLKINGTERAYYNLGAASTKTFGAIYFSPAADTYTELICKTNNATVAAGAWVAIKQEAIGNV